MLNFEKGCGQVFAKMKLTLSIVALIQALWFMEAVENFWKIGCEISSL